MDPILDDPEDDSSHDSRFSALDSNPEAMLDFFFQRGNEELKSELFKCPYCPDCFSRTQLPNHVVGHKKEKKASPNVVCPICAAESGGDPNYVSQNIFGHMQARHVTMAPPSSRTGLTRTYFIKRQTSGVHESLWDYLVSTQNNHPSSAPRCEVCSTALRPQDIAVISSCNHLSHESCLLSQQHCKLCKPKGHTPHPTNARQNPKRQKSTEPSTVVSLTEPIPGKHRSSRRGKK